MNRLSGVLVAACCAMLLSGCSIALRPSLGLRGENEQVKFLDEAVRLNPDNPHAWHYLGREYMDEGRHREARRCFDRALKAQPGFREAEFAKALTFLQEEEWRRAAREFEAFTAANPGSNAGWESLALARLGTGDLDGASLAARRALEADPESRKAETILGRIAYIRGDMQAAANHWRLGRLEEQDKAMLLPIAQDLERYLDQYGQ